MHFHRRKTTSPNLLGYSEGGDMGGNVDAGDAGADVGDTGADGAGSMGDTGDVQNNGMLDDGGAAAYIGSEGNDGDTAQDTTEVGKNNDDQLLARRPNYASAHVAMPPSEEERIASMKADYEHHQLQRQRMQQEMRSSSSHNRSGVDVTNVASGSSSDPTTSGGASSSGTNTEQEFITKWFPSDANLYQFDGSGTITGYTPVNFEQRRDTKKAVCAHVYFFSHGCVKSDPMAQSLTVKLMNIKSKLSFVEHIRNKTDRWLK
jgi:hypothetical protein